MTTRIFPRLLKKTKIDRKPSYIFLVSALLLCLLTAVFSVSHVATAENVSRGDADSWPMFQHDTAHSGSNADAGPLTNHTTWNFTADDTFWTAPAVAGGDVYVTGYASGVDGYICALNASTGQELWSYRPANDALAPYQPDVMVSPPAIAYGALYVASNDTIFDFSDQTVPQQTSIFTSTPTPTPTPAPESTATSNSVVTSQVVAANNQVLTQRSQINYNPTQTPSPSPTITFTQTSGSMKQILEGVVGALIAVTIIVVALELIIRDENQ